MAHDIHSLFISGPAGELEALLNDAPEGATHSALVCHPHPLYGGTMHNKVVYHAMKTLNKLGLPVLRFNFRGAGTSQGVHDSGRGEVEDVRAALDWLDQRLGLPILFVGFSFGAAVGLRAACPDPRVIACVALGTPIAVRERDYTYGFLRECAKPKLFISGSHDEYGPLPELRKLIGTLPEPKKFVVVEGADHFFAGKLDQMRDPLESWIRSLSAPRRASRTC